MLGKLPKSLRAQQGASRIKEGLHNMVAPTILFEELGLKYFGPIDGHDYDVLVETLQANLRFNGPENMFTRIFGRLTAWQNWIFQRPNAVGEKGALKVYGKGDKAAFDWNRV